MESLFRSSPPPEYLFQCMFLLIIHFFYISLLPLPLTHHTQHTASLSPSACHVLFRLSHPSPSSPRPNHITVARFTLTAHIISFCLHYYVCSILFYTSFTSDLNFAAFHYTIHIFCSTLLYSYTLCIHLSLSLLCLS